MAFWPFWSEIGHHFRPFWSEIGYGLCTLVLNRVYLLEELATSSFGDETISLLMFTPTTVYVPSWGEGGGVLSYKGLMGTCGQPRYVFRDFCLKQGIDFIIFCLKRYLFLDDKQSVRMCLFCVRNGGSLCQAFLADTVETVTKNRCVIEATHVLQRKLRKD